MTRLEKLQAKIAELSPEEFSELRVWLYEFDADDWDRQIADDAKAGRLDRLVKEGREAYKEGNYTEL